MRERNLRPDPSYLNEVTEALDWCILLLFASTKALSPVHEQAGSSGSRCLSLSIDQVS